MKKFLLFMGLGYGVIFFLLAGVPTIKGLFSKPTASGSQEKSSESAPSNSNQKDQQAGAESGNGNFQGKDSENSKGVVEKEQTEKIEELKTFYAGGTPSSYLRFKRKNLNGKQEFFYPDQKTWIEIEFQDGVCASFKAFYPNGKLWWELTFEKGFLNGPVRFFYISGNPWVEWTFLKGTFQLNSLKVYSESGEFNPYFAQSVEQNTERRENKAIPFAASLGASTQTQTTYLSGELSSVWPFKEGFLEGVVSFVREKNRVVWREIFFRQGNPFDSMRDYYASEALWADWQWENLSWVNKQTFFYESGTPWVVMTFQKGFLLQIEAFSENESETLSPQ